MEQEKERGMVPREMKAKYRGPSSGADHKLHREMMPEQAFFLNANTEDVGLGATSYTLTEALKAQ